MQVMIASAEIVSVLRVTPAEWERLRYRMDEYTRTWFRINRPEPLATRATRRLCLIATHEHLVACGLITSLGGAGDIDTAVRVTDVERLHQPLSTAAILERLSARSRTSATSVLTGAGTLAPVAGVELLNAASAINDEVRHILAILRPKVGTQSRTLGSIDQQGIEEQRDAVALGLEIAGLDSRDLVPSAELQTEAAPFLNAIPADATGTSEASIIRTDSRAFADWIPSEATIHDVVTFRDPRQARRQVTVMYADKERAEQVLGTDLIYYRTERPGYVVVQYKRMRHYHRDTKARWRYRPDEQMEKEIQRMRSLVVSPIAKDADEWRLTPDPFFFKLVPDLRARPPEHRLSEGIYLPLGYLEVLLMSPTLGKTIGYHNAGRWLTNTQFIELMISGFIGSTGMLTDDLTKLIAESLQANRGAIVVRDDSRTPPKRR